MVQGSPVCLFDGSNGPSKSATTRYTTVVAVPANKSDPWLENWTVPAQSVDGVYPWSRDEMQWVNPSPGQVSGDGSLATASERAWEVAQAH